MNSIVFDPYQHQRLSPKHLGNQPRLNTSQREQYGPIRLSNRVGMYIVSTTFDEDTRIIWSVSPATIVFGFCVSGHSSVQHVGHQRQSLFSQRDNVWVSGTGSSWYQEVKGGQVFKAIYLYTDRTSFLHLMGNSLTKLSPDLYQAVLTDGPDYLQTHKLSAQAVKISESLFENRYTSLNQQLYWEGKGLELLAYQLQRLTAGSCAPPVTHSVVSKREDLLLGECHQLLLERFIDPPTVSELSAWIGLSDFRLNRGFSQMYGLTITKFIAEQRLLWARQLLQTGTHSVSAVARAAGFKHVGTFSNSFYNRFGRRPGELISPSTAIE